MAVRSGYRLKSGIKHPGLGAIKLLSKKANKGLSLEILQKKRNVFMALRYEVLLADLRTWFVQKGIKAKECPAGGGQCW